MNYVVMTLAFLGAIFFGGYALLAWFADGMSDAPTNHWALDLAKRQAAFCVVCIVIFLIAYKW